MIIENRTSKKRFEVSLSEWENVISKGVAEYDVIEDDAPIEVKSMREEKKEKKKSNQKTKHK
jgi:hypothetical protein